jgi:hypothetical protein
MQASKTTAMALHKRTSYQFVEITLDPQKVLATLTLSERLFTIIYKVQFHLVKNPYGT